MGNLLLLTALLILAADAQDDCAFKNKQLRKKEDLYNECLDEGYKSSIVGCAATGEESDLSKREKKRCRKVEEDLILCDWSCVVNGDWGEFGEWSECSAACGGGTQTRKRSCDDPQPAEGGAQCEGDEGETRVCNVDPCPPRLPSWPEDFKWSNAGVPDGYTCMRVLEFAEPKDHTWEDNFFCWKNGLADPGLRWSMAGEIEGQKCVQITEAADPDTWTDNYICLPLDTPYDLKWSSAGPLEGLECIQWLEPADPDTWDDNYLCHSWWHQDPSLKTVNGAWTHFGKWSECSASCGTGTQSRKRSCENPSPLHGGAGCEGDEEETQACNTKPCPVRLPSWPEDFKWSSAGVPDGYTCMRVLEFAEPKEHTWEDNFFCWKNGLADPGLRWSMAGEIAGQKCVQIIEAADPHTWTDNYICLPLKSPYDLKWSSAGPIEGLDCIQWLETADPDTWDDNYLCHGTFEGPEIVNHLPDWPEDFKWSNAGVPDGYTCMRVLEFAEPKEHTWQDNFFCWMDGLPDPGLRWSMAGAIEGQKCVQITEAADPHTWTDNYICLPLDTPYDLKWSSAGPLEGLECIQWLEPADPDTWDDNYLCFETMEF